MSCAALAQTFFVVDACFARAARLHVAQAVQFTRHARGRECLRT